MERTHKYEVHVNIIIFNEIDMSGNSENFKYEFKDGNLYEMRIAALSKANDLIEMFENEMPVGHEFQSPYEAMQMNYKNSKAYTIDVYFVINDSHYYQIVGDDELQNESEEVEKAEFERMNVKYSNFQI